MTHQENNFINTVFLLTFLCTFFAVTNESESEKVLTVSTFKNEKPNVLPFIKNKSAYYKQSHFFIYGVGLSPQGKIGAYSSDINNNITLFYTQTRENIATYKATNMIVNSIYFTTKNKFYVVSNSKDVCYYETK